MIERIGLSFIDDKPISQEDEQFHERMMSAKVFRMHKKVADSAFEDRPYSLKDFYTMDSKLLESSQFYILTDSIDV